jgi:flagellar hook-basal body complex protein FliE
LIVSVTLGYPEKFGAILPKEQPDLREPAAKEAPPGTGIVPSVTDKHGEPLPPSFADHLEDFVSGVDKTQKTAEYRAEEFAVGHQNDIHGTMIAVEQAEISLHLLANVRNRVVDLYREVMRMGS